MANKVFREHHSISSDNVLFDFEGIIRHAKKDLGLDESTFIHRIRHYYAEKFPHTLHEERTSMVSAFIISPMSYDKFVLTLDMLNVDLTLTISN